MPGTKQLFDLVVSDMEQLRKDPRCFRIIAQQIASADSICANMDEGYGRLSRAEYLRFLDFSRSSARQTRGRDERMSRWLHQATIQNRVALVDEILGILTKTIETLKADLQSRGKTSCLREDAFPPEEDLPSAAGTRHSTLDTPDPSLL